MLFEKIKQPRRVVSMHNRIQWAIRFPAFADYRVFAEQPSWWVETLDNYFTAESLYNKQKNG